MTQPEENRGRLEEGDEPYLSLGPVTITVNETHALQLGLIGGFAGVGYSSGMMEEALAFTGLVFLVALGLRKAPGKRKGKEIPIAVKTKRHEPWWFISSYTVTFIVGAVVRGVI